MIHTDAMVDALKRWEGLVLHMYLDTHDLVTVGIGNLIKTVSEAMALPFYMNGERADDDVIAHAYEIVRGKPAGLASGAYRLIPSVELLEPDARGLCMARLEKEFIPGVRRKFTKFDEYPEPVQAALIDMSYNLGVAGLAKFEKLAAACERGDWITASSECHRLTCRKERNAWTERQFTSVGAVS